MRFVYNTPYRIKIYMNTFIIVVVVVVGEKYFISFLMLLVPSMLLFILRTSCNFLLCKIVRLLLLLLFVIIVRFFLLLLCIGSHAPWKVTWRFFVWFALLSFPLSLFYIYVQIHSLYTLIHNTYNIHTYRFSFPCYHCSQFSQLTIFHSIRHFFAQVFCIFYVEYWTVKSLICIELL